MNKRGALDGATTAGALVPGANGADGICTHMT